MTTTLYLVRHGETYWNIEGRYQGQLDPPLTNRGRQQAAETASQLAIVGVAAIYSSDLARAYDTAEALAVATGLPLQLDARLRELNQGKWQGVLVDDIRLEWPEEFKCWKEHPWHNHPPGGETLEEVQTRLFSAIDDILARHRGQTVAVFSHKLPIALLKIRFQRYPAQEIWSLLPANGTWEVFEIDDDE